MSPATGLVLLLIAVFVFLRTVRGTPRLGNLVLYGKQQALKYGGTGGPK